MSLSKLTPDPDPNPNPNPNPNPDHHNHNAKKTQTLDLGNGSEVVYVPRFVAYDDAWKLFNYLDSRIPWTRPTLRVFGRSCLQPRDTCYVASAGLPDLMYSGYQPHAYSWDDFPPLKDILDTVHKMLPGSRFNSLLLNRYEGGNDYVGWHSDDEKLYGPTPEIASVSFGCERDFFLKKKCPKSSQEEVNTGAYMRSNTGVGVNTCGDGVGDDEVEEEEENFDIEDYDVKEFDFTEKKEITRKKKRKNHNWSKKKIRPKAKFQIPTPLFSVEDIGLLDTSHRDETIKTL